MDQCPLAEGCTREHYQQTQPLEYSGKDAEIFHAQVNANKDRKGDCNDNHEKRATVVFEGLSLVFWIGKARDDVIYGIDSHKDQREQVREKRIRKPAERILEHYLPFHSGLRFSTNACMPSF